MHDFVTTDSHEHLPPSSPVPSERPASESPAFAALRARMAATLQSRAADIAVRWDEQSRTVALREPQGGTDSGEASLARAFVESLAAALASDGAISDDLIALGLRFGVDAFERGGSLYHALKGLDLLAAMMLYAVETSIAGELTATAADGVHLSRRIQQATALLILAATRGYTQAMGGAMRDRFRHLRHDLRNPLGTINSVLAMMDDETMPDEARTHPRFRAMAKRNARSLGELIADRLSDAAAVVPAMAQQSASLRTVACGVRRGLRAEAEARETTVVIGSERFRVMVDAAGFELMLHELLFAALQEASAGDELSVGFGEARDDRTAVTLLCAPARRPVIDTGALRRLSELAMRMGGRLEAVDQAITLLIPVRRLAVVAQGPERVPSVSTTPATDDPSVATGPLDRREPGHDVRGAREREHGQPRAL